MVIVTFFDGHYNGHLTVIDTSISEEEKCVGLGETIIRSVGIGIT